MAHVVLLVPMRSELAPVVRELGLRKTSSRAPELPVVHAGRRGEVDVTAVLIGVGTGRAAAATERVLSSLDPVDHVVVVGIAGGIAPGQAIGDLVVPEVVVDGVSGTEHRPHRLGTEQPSGILSTSDELITDPAAVAALADRGVIALDMETAAVAAACERQRQPWSVFRAISDRADDGLVDAEVAAMAGADGSASLPAVLWFVARHPTRVRDLARMGRDMKVAARNAAVAAAAACDHLDGG